MDEPQARTGAQAEPTSQAEVEEKIGHLFAEASLLERALTHSSYRVVDPACNERLEFLGDSILGMIVAEHLYNVLPGEREGELTQIRAEVVSRTITGRACRALGLEGHLRLGKGMAARSQLPLSVHANVYEALVGAVYQDGGLTAARRFVLRTLAGAIERAIAREEVVNYKSRLQDIAQRQLGIIPEYPILSEHGPDHDRTFEVAARVGERHFPPAVGRNKKEAEQRAARMALDELESSGEA